jgi:uncharacterized protein (TIGR03437 family)
VKIAVFALLASLAQLSAQTVTLTATPAALTFNYVINAALPAAQTATVKASSGTPTYTVAVTGTNVLWLTATPDSGKTPASLSVRVNPTGLPVGTYSGVVNVIVTGAATPAAIPVTLVVSSPLPTLSLSATTLNFTAPPLQPAPQTFQLATTGGPVSFTATATGAPWLSLSPSTGVVLPGEQAIITVSVDASAVTPQNAPYTTKITIVASGVPASNKTQNVTVTLLANSSTPTIATVWPAGVQLNSPATTVTLRGTNFYTGTVVKISGVTTPLSTTVLSPTALLAIIPAPALTSATTLNLIASNPQPGGDSSPAPFMISGSPVVQAVVSVASNAGVSISPGELVTLYGANIGPLAAATLTTTNGFVDTSLGGVSVTIDGQPAPLLYVSQNQISVQVPYEVTAGPGKNVLVTNGLVVSPGTVAIGAVAPGIFSLDGSGVGQAAALNYNATTGLYSLNLGTAPAKIGDIVVLYITGEGDYAQSLSPRTGLLVPPTLSPLPQLSPLPVVTIGGAVATVQYAGPLVGSILGLMQINATVPAGSTTGTSVPVLVTVGGVPAQSGVTLSIHP